MSDTIDLEKVSAMVPADLVESIKKIAARHDRSLSVEIRRAVREYVDAHASEAA